MTEALRARSTDAMDRRDVLRLAFAAPAAMTFAGRTAAQETRTVSLRLTLDADRPGPTIPTDFTGLSYEAAALSDPSIFAPDNAQLIGFVRRLGPSGVLRIGGNTSDYSTWTQAGASAATIPPAGPDPGGRPPPRRPITPLAIRNLRGFLDATGWRLIYGLNLGTETPDVVADEAAHVATAMGATLIAFQLGNEPDLFRRNGLRKPDYDFTQFAAEWSRYVAAVRARIPHAPFAGPDTAFSNDWLAQFAKEFGGRAPLLSRHYYALGPPGDPSVTVERLLAPHNQRFDALLEGMRGAREAAPAQPFRLTETNSCYGGGMPGVSDTFASALWGADLMYRMAWAGAAGLNFHGGRYGWYSPIAGTRDTGLAARPLYYGMLMFTEAGPGELVSATLSGNAVAPLFTTYALKAPDGSLKVVLINKHVNVDVSLIAQARNGARVQRLHAPRLDDIANTTFGGTRVGHAGAWSSAAEEVIRSRNGIAVLPVPRGSAALVKLE